MKNEIKNEDFFNKIIFGPPGTGKSFKVKEFTGASTHIFRVTFHEDYSYYDFVGQYKPVVIKDYAHKISTIADQRDSEKEPSPIISYDFIPGIFTQSYIAAHEHPDETIYLIIEELNRGNCSAIFGDIFQLLDRDNNGSRYPIKASKELYKFLKDYKINGTDINLPKNLKIIATMNTSDQSLFPVDSAFKRRWQQEYCKIEYNNSLLKLVTIEGTTVNWLKFIEKVNEKILTLLSNEDKQIGHWFVQPIHNKITEEDFKYKVISYLYYDVFKHHKVVFRENSFSKLIDKSVKDIVNVFME